MRFAAAAFALAVRAIAALSLLVAFSAHAAEELADGEIRRVDRDAKKITIKHGEIKSLDMPPMTMVFQVKDLALLDKVKAGDRVRFSAVKLDGGYAVTSVEVAK